MCKGALSLARQTLDVLRQTSGAVPRCGPTNSSHSASPNPTLLPLDSARPRAPLAASAPAPFWEAPPGSRARPLRGPLCPGLEGHGSGRRRHSFPAQTPRQGHRAVRHPAALADLGAERPSRRGMSPRSTRGHRFRPGVPSPSPGRSDSFPSPASGDRCTHSSSCLLVKTLLLIKSRFRRVCTQGRERGVTGSRGVCPAVSGPPSGLVGQQTHSAPRGLSDIESPAPVPLLFLTRLLAGRHSADSWHRGLVSRTDTRTRRPRSAGSGVWPIFSPSASPLFKGLGVRGLSPARGDTLQNWPLRGPTLRQRSLRRTRP